MGTREEKAAIIEDLRERLRGTDLAIVADYRGLTVGQMQTLRRELRAAGGQFKVAKNTLLRLAAEREDQAGLTQLLDGPSGIAFADGDMVTVAKALTTFAKSVDALEVRGALMNGQAISADEVRALASLPSREELLAKMLGSMQSPATNLVGVLSAVARSLALVLQARADQLQQSEGA
ncbi:MAG: 50S ribosomal protein L10 [Chloroflexi bacterium]|nr:50S ribosomal protein L10 [Chloroflexota bacterium]